LQSATVITSLNLPGTLDTAVVKVNGDAFMAYFAVFFFHMAAVLTIETESLSDSSSIWALFHFDGCEIPPPNTNCQYH